MKKALLDTNFFIKLLNKASDQHPLALEHYEYFIGNDIKMYLSTIVVGEYCVRGLYSDLPLKDVRLLAYNLPHSKEAGKLAKFLFDNNKLKEINGGRSVITNDIKLLAQAASDGFDFFVSGDKPCNDIHSILIKNQLVNYSYLDFGKGIDANFPQSKVIITNYQHMLDFTGNT